MFKQIILCVTGLLWNVNTIDNKHLFHEKSWNWLVFGNFHYIEKNYILSFYILAAAKFKAIAYLWKLKVRGYGLSTLYISKQYYISKYI